MKCVERVRLSGFLYTLYDKLTLFGISKTCRSLYTNSRWVYSLSTNTPKHCTSLFLNGNKSYMRTKHNGLKFKCRNNTIKLSEMANEKETVR